MKAVLALLFLLLTCTTQARLLETLQQCTDRYGAADQPDPAQPLYQFEKSGLLLLIEFDAFDRAQVISIAPADPSGTLTPSQVQIIVEANLGADLQITRDATTVSFQSADNQLLARYQPRHSILHLITRAKYRADTSRIEFKERQALQGF